MLPLIRGFLQVRGLTLSEEKTKITHIDEGFDFLGFNIRKYKGKFLIKPSKESQKKFQRKINEIITSHHSIPQESLIRLLNPVITGWANYYQHVDRAKCSRKWIFTFTRNLCNGRSGDIRQRVMVGSRKVFPQTQGQVVGLCRTFR